MNIPLEDTVDDILSKAQQGLGLTPEALASRLKISPETLALAHTFTEKEPQAEIDLAYELRLDATALRAIARGDFRPSATPPKTGFFMTTTAYGGMTVNAFLIWDPSTLQAAAFDTGADCSPMVEVVKMENLILRDVYLTHTHIDHVVELDRLMEKLGGTITVHAPEAEPLAHAASFRPGITFPLGKLQVESRDTSGHSSGGTSYHIHGLDGPLVVVGDALFAGSVGGIKGDYSAALQRIRDHILSGQDQTTIAPGHGPLTTVGQERASNPFFPEYKKSARRN